jgi:predicted nucleic acid-binding protein
MTAYVLDTSALLAHHRNEPGAARVQVLLEDPEAEIHVAAPSLTEMARRLLTLGADAATARTVALEYAGLATSVLSIDTAVSIRAFELGSENKTRLPLVDALIAACAGLIGATLVHRDAHFEGLPPSLVAVESL